MADVTALRRKVEQRASRLRDLAIEDIEADIEPSPIDTGELRRSKRVARIDAPTRVGASITYTAAHAELLDKGTRPHPIVARNASTLSFFWPKAGKRVYPRRVNHPGSQKHKGWFSDHVTPAKWRDALQNAVRRP